MNQEMQNNGWVNPIHGDMSQEMYSPDFSGACDTALSEAAIDELQDDMQQVSNVLPEGWIGRPVVSPGSTVPMELSELTNAQLSSEVISETDLIYICQLQKEAMMVSSATSASSQDGWGWDPVARGHYFLRGGVRVGANSGPWGYLARNLFNGADFFFINGILQHGFHSHGGQWHLFDEQSGARLISGFEGWAIFPNHNFRYLRANGTFVTGPAAMIGGRVTIPANRVLNAWYFIQGIPYLFDGCGIVPF